MLGTLCLLLVIVSAGVTFMNWSVSWVMFGLSAIWTIGLSIWAIHGWWKWKLDIGWKGQLLLFNQRMNFFFTEGRRFIPFPFGINSIDCREQIMKLDTLEAITKNNVKVSIDGTITYQVVDLHKRANVKDSEIKQGIDDARDQIIRVEVANTDLDEVLKMHSDLGKKMHKGLKKSSARWGIKIIEVIITKVITDPKVAEDLELETREELQKKGQLVEAQNIASLVVLFTEPAPKGAGLSLADAKEMAQLITGKANPKNITGYTFPPEILQAILELMAGRTK